jgi:hypothetical protein
MKRLVRRVAAVGSVAGLIASAAALGATVAPSVAFAQAVTPARAHIRAGAKAAKANDWDAALAEYKAAEAAEPSQAGAAGVAEAYDGLRQNVDAYNAFKALVDTYGPRLPKKDLAAAQARLTALAKVTGLLDVRVTPEGATVAVDTVLVGTSPLPAPVRVATGLHRVQVSRSGFEDAEALPTVAGGETATVTLALREIQKSGKVLVRMADGEPATLFVDGVERGPLPWEGVLEIGPHDVFARSAKMASQHQTADVVRGQTLSLVLSASKIESAVTVATADRHGLISIDGKVVGDGSFEGALPVGEHTLHIGREGYDSVDKKLTLREGASYAETFTLTPTKVARALDARPLDGAVGGFMLAGAFQVNGLNGDFSEPCSFASTPGPSSCHAGSPIGGAVMGYVGYTANPVGVDVLFGGQLDSATAGFTTTGSKPVTESFVIPRMGGFIAPRARISGQTRSLRLTFAAGVGIAVRAVALSGSGVSGLFGSEPSSTYVAPAITMEGSIHWRVTDQVALGAGLMYWAESAGNGVLLKNGSALTAPAVVLSATQAMLLPFLGMEFGP